MALQGSSAAYSALRSLAFDLNLHEDVLKSALDDAFDLPVTQQNGNPSLSLHITLARMGYHETGLLYCKLREFREINAAGLLSGEPGKDEEVWSGVGEDVSSADLGGPAMRDKPYRSIAPVPAPRVRPPLQHTPEAMTWRPEYAASAVPSPLRHIDPNLHPSLQHTPEAMTWRPEQSCADLKAQARVKMEEAGPGGLEWDGCGSQGRRCFGASGGCDACAAAGIS